MASDLSTLIQDGLSGTLESLLAKKAQLEKITKTHPSDLKDQCIKVDTTFEFQNITSNWSFFIPALSASRIFNLMMGEDIEPVDVIDEDMLDALNEVVSNISGGLTTAINSSEFDDLGSVKFSISGNQTVDGEAYSVSDTLFKILISLEDKEVTLFINFDEAIMPYIEIIASSEVTQVVEIEEVNDDIEEETVLDETNDDIKEKDISEEETTNDIDKENILPENVDDDDDHNTEKQIEDEKPKNKLSILKKLNFFKIDEDLSDEEKKQTKLKKIVIAVGTLLGITILIAVILYFTGAFESEIIEEPQDINITQVEKKKNISIKIEARKKYITFNMSQINVQRLNKKLSILTKYEILEEDAIEKIKAQEKEKLYKEQQARLEKFAKNNKEEPLFKKVENKIQKIDNIIKNTNNDKIEDKKIKVKEISLNLFIQISTLKLNQFKSFIKKAKLVNANLSICKDINGKTQVFIGPFQSEDIREKILKTLSKKKITETKNLNLSKEEFERRCSF